MIEEIDSAAYNKHYFDKVFGEVGADPQAFLAAAFDYVKQETTFFAQPGAAAAVDRLLQQHLPAGSAAAAAAAGGGSPPAAAGGAAAAAPAEQPAQAPPPADDQAVAAAGEAPSPPVQLQQVEDAQQEQQEQGQEQEGEAEQAESSALKPNEGNGADMGRYSWTQSLAEVVVSIPVPAGTKGRACDVSIARDRLRVGLKGQPPVLDGPLFAAVKPDDCLWNLVDGKQLELTLQKRDGMQWWRCVVQGEPEIDVQKVEPESSKLTDLDPEMRATVEKMMYDQRQKAMGLPTSEEQRKADIMQQFMAAHPEMDFSNAKIEM